MDCLTDKYLIDNCVKMHLPNYPKYISIDTKNSLKEFLSEFDNDGNILNDKIDCFHNLWKSLLSDAIIFLKSKDKREYQSDGDDLPKRDLVAFGVRELQKYFEEYRSFEALLYGAESFYRDHVMHVFRVWLLGMWLIEKFGLIIHWDFKLKGLDITEDEILAMWCIIALTHDLGYPLNKVEKVRDKINSMMRYFGGSEAKEKMFEVPAHHHFINDFILKFIGSKLIERKSNNGDPERKFGTAIQTKYYLKFSKSLENFDHGIISCILLMKNLVFFLESDLDLGSPFTTEDARQFYIRREILRAIAAHTCTDIYHLQPNSLPFILILADELQVWGRPTFQEIKSGRQRLALKAKIHNINRECIKVRINITEERRMTKGDETAAKQYFIGMCRKWHKWLRSALGASERKFFFCLETQVNSVDGKTMLFRFENKPQNVVDIYIDNSKQNLVELLYE